MESVYNKDYVRLKDINKELKDLRGRVKKLERIPKVKHYSRQVRELAENIEALSNKMDEQYKRLLDLISQ